MSVGEVAVRPSAVEGSVTEPLDAAESFDEVFRREGLKMVRVAFLMVGSSHQAEEIVQDAFAQLLERWERVQRPGAYLRTCVVNGCLRARRRRNVEQRLGTATERSYAVDFKADHMSDVLATIPAKRRAALVLRYYEDMSEAEIANLLGVRPGTVKSRLHRGLTQLREVIMR